MLTTKKEQEAQLDSRLLQMKLLHPKRRFGRRQIADFVRSDTRTIERIERSGLLKLRRALRGVCPPGLFDEMCTRRTVAL